MEFPIDFVVDWVDGSDKTWQDKKKQYLPVQENDDREVRYRDWDLLRYWFRAVETHAPWVNRVHFVVDHQIPKWLNTKNKKLHVVDHCDYIPDQYLPVFNSNAIEMGINKIPELSEHFVFFNDDFYLNKSVTPSDFFSKDGRPRDAAVLSVQLPKQDSITHITTNNMEIVNQYFSKQDVMKQLHKFIRFSYGKQNIKTISTLIYPILLGFQDFHIPISLKKSVMNNVWGKIEPQLNKTISHKFRSNEDLNIFLYRYFQLLSGDFVPRSVKFGQYYGINDDFDQIIVDIKQAKHAAIVLNDQESIDNFDAMKLELHHALELRYPQKSTFEK